jgi:hypothetical protein
MSFPGLVPQHVTGQARIKLPHEYNNGERRLFKSANSMPTQINGKPNLVFSKNLGSLLLTNR